MELEILYEDEDIVVVLKPQGLLSQADEKGGENLTDLLKASRGKEIYPVHRLDKGTGGVMVFAKTKSSAAELSRQVRENKIKKLYKAEIHGVPEENQGKMEDLLFFDRRKNKSFVVKRERKGVKKALLDYEVISSFEGKSLVKIKLHTGRTHQIRVQFASRGFPLLGDRRYGAQDEEKNIHLWAYELSFIHPTKGVAMSVNSG